MDETRSLRIAGWAGIVFSILSLIVIPLACVGTFPPALGANGAGFAAWYRDHKLGFLVGNFLGIAAFAPGFVQLAVLAARFRKAEGPDGWFAPLVLSTGTFAYAVFACSLAVFQALPFLVDPGTEDAALAMGTLGAVWFALDGLAALPFVLAVAWAAAATGALPAWVARVTWPLSALAVLMSVGSLTDTPEWLAAGGLATAIGFVGFFVWTFALAVLFLRIGPVKAA